MPEESKQPEKATYQFHYVDGTFKNQDHADDAAALTAAKADKKVTEVVASRGRRRVYRKETPDASK